jgi:hypothetical protein
LEVVCDPRITLAWHLHRQGPIPAPHGSLATSVHTDQFAFALKHIVNPDRLEACRVRSPKVDLSFSQCHHWLEARRWLDEDSLYDEDWLFYKFGIPEPDNETGRNGDSTSPSGLAQSC